MSTALEDLARGIDDACEAQDVSALRAYLETIASMSRAPMSAVERGALALYEANIHAALRTDAGSASSDWVEPLLEDEIRALRVARRALAAETTQTLGTDLKLRVITNLANSLNRCGRIVEAVELWDEALSEHPRFGMAMGNKGLALYWYARYAGTGQEQALLLRISYRTLVAALRAGVEPHAREEMEDLVAHLRSRADWNEVEVPLHPFQRGRSKQERRYRRWCVQHRAVLSSINDVELEAEALQDTLTLPSITVPADEATALMPRPYAIFNQLKQEYVSARYLVFEALCEKGDKLHFADKGVVLFDALDYRFYRTWIEKLKMAFLALHAIFDKIAYLVNEYWKVGLEPKRVSFASVWRSADRSNPGLSARFAASSNWPLRGLYWLSRDFHLKPVGEGAVDPEARVLNEIRNHIAHKYLRVHDHFLYDAEGDRARNGDELGYAISDQELEHHVMKLLKLARSGLIGLSCAVVHEEAELKRKLGDEGIFPMVLPVLEDQFRL
ncbi:MAG: hypothetical protein H0W47_10340 [Polaromonas sp.]|uniref:LA2681 family HEPN domain-containing protein n=1 Tax=Polaromonas sp. TaxID=1869339 RepID=UPI0018162C9C|nr:LA2681 family HEPN domain-containing protein [Polaromonas sp.]MBA3594179.1 hypothetical protein [Polaromonas sp.]